MQILFIHIQLFPSNTNNKHTSDPIGLNFYNIHIYVYNRNLKMTLETVSGYYLIT